MRKIFYKITDKENKVTFTPLFSEREKAVDCRIDTVAVEVTSLNDIPTERALMEAEVIC